MKVINQSYLIMLRNVKVSLLYIGETDATSYPFFNS